MQALRGAWRLTRVLLHVLHGLAIVLLRFGRLDATQRRERVRWWSQRMLAVLDVGLIAEGSPRPGAKLFVANHISYLDPIIILMHIEANVVAKSEVRRWPLIGFTGTLVGTIFVNRHEKSSRNKTAGLIYSSLNAGKSILLFPEGTTTRGHTILPFKPRSFEAARSAGVPVQPVMISYKNPSVAFVDDHTFIPHFFNLFLQKRIESIVTFGPVFTDDNACEASHDWMQAHLSPHSLIAM